MKFETRQFGALEVPEEEILRFPAGVPGFEDDHRFVVVEDGTIDPFRWLQSLDHPELAFLVIPTVFVAPGYQPELSAEGRTALALGEGDQAEALFIVTIPEDPTAMTANLRAPVLINRAARLGRQEISSSDRYSLRQPVLAAAQASKQSVAGTK